MVARRNSGAYHKELVFIDSFVSVRVEHVERDLESAGGLCNGQPHVHIVEDVVFEKWPTHLLVKIDSKNRYSVYERIPLSWMVLNKRVFPFRKTGV
jgi:hypothetical protein